MDEKEYYAKHFRNIRRSSRRIRAMLEKSYANLGREIASQKFVSPATFTWSKNVKLTKRVDLILGQQNFRLKNEITRSIISEWKLASQKNDELVRKYIGDTYVYHKVRKELFQANTEALNAFLLRTDTNQFNLSKRVWNLTNETKTQLKYHIGQGIATGKGASEISRDIRNVLVEPNRLYRRVRDKTGKLVLSKPAKLYKPGSGAYRSSYKNALRLAITETSMAYRASDYTRRAQLPFIVGYKVNLSGSHPMTDICDDMKGVYPKEFRFVGWHPHCLCYTTAILMKKEKFIKYLKTGKLDKRMYVNKIPIKAERYVNKHANKIVKMKNKPYWSENFNKDLKLKSSIGKMRSMEELALKTEKPFIFEDAIIENEKWISKLKRKPLEWANIKKYTEKRFLTIGQYLRKGIKMTDLKLQKVMEYDIEMLTKTLAEAPKFRDTLYRGMSIEDDKAVSLIASLKKGNIIVDKSFMSTSYSKEFVEKRILHKQPGEVDFIYTIKSKSGVLIERISQYGKEHEVLFNPNSKLLVKDVKKIVGFEERIRYEVLLEEVYP